MFAVLQDKKVRKPVLKSGYDNPAGPVLLVGILG